MTSEHVPGQLKYDACMTKQVSGPQGTKIAGRHMAMFPKGEAEYDLKDSKQYNSCFSTDSLIFQQACHI